VEAPPVEPVGGTQANVPLRPSRWDDLSWRPQPAVRWFSPAVLAETGLRATLAAILGAYLDKRELQAAIPTAPLDASGRRELWIDYTADTGDGFPATYSVAWTMARREVHVPGRTQPLPRGDLLVLGGDQAYPTASTRAYEQRLIGPFTAAFPWAPPDREPWLLALPGNHDWYDGLTSFFRTFCQRKTIGGRRTVQTRSYFAVQLPHRWWLLGVDSRISSYVDEPQLRFLESLDLRHGDRVILCAAEPTWVDARHDPMRYRNLAYIERKIIRPRGARVCLTLAGDLHHYSRYAAADGSQKVTSGGGGAYTHPTHQLPDDVPLPRNPAWPDDHVMRHRLATRHPGAVWSRVRAFAAVGLPLWNPSFLAVPAVIITLLVVGAIRQQRASAATWAVQDVVGNILASSAALSVLLLLTLTLVAFAAPPAPLRRPVPRLIVRTVMGVAHALLHLLVAATAAWVASRLTRDVAGTGGTVLAVLLAGALGAVASAITVGAYLAITNGVPPARWSTHGNEAFAAQRHTAAKQFVRLHLDGDGVLRLYCVGIDRVHNRWTFDPDAPQPDDAWLAPDDDLTVTLLDGPVVIDARDRRA
jgi:hypothetical protein